MQEKRRDQESGNFVYTHMGSIKYIIIYLQCGITKV